MAVQCGNVSKVPMENLLLKSLIKIFIFCAKSNFNQTYLKTGLKTQNGEELSLDLIFLNHFSKLRIHSKLDKNQSKLNSSQNKKDLNAVIAAHFLVFFLLLAAQKKTPKTGQL